MSEPLAGGWESSHFWQQQARLAQVSRDSVVPHAYARAAAVASKSPQTPRAQPGPGLTLVDAAAQLLQQDKLSVQQQQLALHSHTPLYTARWYAQEKRERAEEERVRHINEDINHQFWTAIDLSGQGLTHLSPKLCGYTFLQRLYLSHNNLTTLPSALTKMTQLKVLDLSHNLLTELPAEIGFVTSLKQLFLFDNQIKVLPYEMGYLFQLELIGLEGNPVLDLELRELLARSGTRGLVTDLRDRAPPGDPPKPREWMQLTEVPSNSFEFSVLTYNTLCDRMATPQAYPYTPSWALAWDYRSQLLKEVQLACLTDIVCLQEVNTDALEEHWIPLLGSRGYKHIFYPKTRARTMSSPKEARMVDGCVLFYNASRFRLIEKHSIEYNSRALAKDDLKKSEDIFNRIMVRDNVGMVGAFELVEAPGQVLLVATTHLHWDPACRDVKLVQTALLLEETEKFAQKFVHNPHFSRARDMKSVPILVCGDFNSTADSGVFQLCNYGSVAPQHDDLDGFSYGTFTKDGILHRLPLKTAYPGGAELPFTNYTPDFKEAIDYIFYSTPTLQVTSVLGPVDEGYAERYVGFPNAHNPSDHIPIAASLAYSI